MIIKFIEEINKFVNMFDVGVFILFWEFIVVLKIDIVY